MKADEHITREEFSAFRDAQNELRTKLEDRVAALLTDFKTTAAEFVMSIEFKYAKKQEVVEALTAMIVHSMRKG
jgi:hypothetical protein